MKKKSIVIQFVSSRSPSRMTMSPFTMLLLESCHPFYFKSCFSGSFKLPEIFLPWISGLANKVGQWVGQPVCLLPTHIVWNPAVHNAKRQNHPPGELFRISLYTAQNHCSPKTEVWQIISLPYCQINFEFPMTKRIYG